MINNNSPGGIAGVAIVIDDNPHHKKNDLLVPDKEDRTPLNLTYMCSVLASEKNLVNIGFLYRPVLDDSVERPDIFLKRVQERYEAAFGVEEETTEQKREALFVPESRTNNVVDSRRPTGVAGAHATLGRSLYSLKE